MKQSLELLPHSTETEVQVLGAMMLSAEAAGYVISMLEKSVLQKAVVVSKNPSDVFYDGRHQHIYKAILALWSNPDKPIPDIITLSEQLKRLGTLEKAGGTYYLSEINMQTPTAGHVKSHVLLLLSYYIRRCLATLADDVKSKALDLMVDELDLLISVNNDIQVVQQSITKKHEYVGEHLTNKAIEVLELLKNGDKVLIGYPDVDDVVSLLPGKVMLIGARPSVGKTSLGLSMAANMLKAGKKVCYFSMEMTHAQIWCRLASIILGLPLKWVLNDYECVKKHKDYSYFESLLNNFTLDPAVGMNDLELSAKIKHYCERYLIDCVFIDYLGLIQCSDKRLSTANDRVTKISQSIVIAAKGNEVPIIALSQLSRAVENRAEPKPTLSDLRDSGSLEQDADAVMFIYRPVEDQYDSKGNAYRGKGTTTHLLIAKNRDGDTTELEKSVKFIKSLAKFENIDEPAPLPKPQSIQGDIDF